nr:hypothetical protein [Kribbella sindirgiensis]
MHLRAARCGLCFGAGSVAADQVDRRPGAVPRDEIAAVGGVLRLRNHRARDIQAFPAEPLEDGLQHRDDPVLDKNRQQLVEVLEVLVVQLIEMAVRQVFEPDVEALVLRAVPRADRAHVRLHRHQQDRVETLGLSVQGVLTYLLGGGAPGQSPGGVGHQYRRCAVGVHEAAAAGGHPPEAVRVERIDLVRSHGLYVELSLRPLPPPSQRRRKPHLSDLPIPERWPAECETALVLEFDPFAGRRQFEFSPDG